MTVQPPVVWFTLFVGKVITSLRTVDYDGTDHTV